MSAEGSWAALVEGLRLAGERLAAQTADLDPRERADGYRALLRALNNHLGRFEVDRERPELVPFNGWRQKFLMDNPDFRYWVADVRDDRRYRITGALGDAVYQSITAYAGGRLADAAATARLDSDRLTIDADGRFEVILSRERPERADWLVLPEGATAVWVRQFHRDATVERLGWCRIDALDAPPVPESLDPQRFARHLQRLGGALAMLPQVFSAAAAADREHPNEIRHWSEMTGGAAFTEPDIHYLRGAWELDEDEALVIEGPVVPCRYWNVLLYSRFLNSLDYRSRRVSRTSGTATLVDGRYRFVLAARHPGGHGDWLDTEGRRFGLFVMRWLQPETIPSLPNVRRCRLGELAGGR
jgi:hypothetical protein